MAFRGFFLSSQFATRNCGSAEKSRPVLSGEEIDIAWSSPLGCLLFASDPRSECTRRETGLLGAAFCGCGARMNYARAPSAIRNLRMLRARSCAPIAHKSELVTTSAQCTLPPRSGVSLHGLCLSNQLRSALIALNAMAITLTNTY